MVKKTKIILVSAVSGAIFLLPAISIADDSSTDANFNINATVPGLFGLAYNGTINNGTVTVNFNDITTPTTGTGVDQQAISATIFSNAAFNSNPASNLTYKLSEASAGQTPPEGAQFYMINGTDLLGFDVSYTACDGNPFPVNGNNNAIVNGQAYTFTSASQYSIVQQDPTNTQPYCDQYDQNSPTGTTGHGTFTFTIAPNQNPPSGSYASNNMVLTICTSTSCT